MKIAIEKFPQILFQGKPLVWDTRQAQSASDEWVLVHMDAHEKGDIRAALLKRAGARFIGPPGSGLDLEVRDTRKFLGLAAADHYNFPSQNFKLFGVTGTNGKTTCATLLRAQLVAKGFCVAELGTLGLRIFRDQNEIPIFEAETGFTTADAPTLQNLFSQFVENQITAVVMEASSHAASLGRVAGCDFDGMLFTNLSQDHLDFHKSMEAYEDAKAQLFLDYLPLQLSSLELSLFKKVVTKKEKSAAINFDDAAGIRISEALPSTISALGYASSEFKKARAAIPTAHFTVLSSSAQGSELSIEMPKISATHIISPLIGRFNAENLCGAFCLLQLNGLEAPAALSEFGGAAGRMQAIHQAGQPAVFVDYSHTPDALKKALLTLKQVLPKGAQLVVAFGCGGDRDAGKRPVMGEIAATLADQVILCSDNPRTEDPMSILKQIEAGIEINLRSKVIVEEDRRRAIEAGIIKLDVQRGDALLIAGKGHEEYQVIGQVKHPFSDAQVARDFLSRAQ